MKGKEVGLESVWEFPQLEPTEYQKRILLSRATEIAVRTIWRNFKYVFGGDVYLQSHGGPIGARVSMACSRLIIQDWV